MDRRGPEGRELAELKLGDSSAKRVGQRNLGVKVSWKLNREYVKGLGSYFPPYCMPNHQLLANFELLQLSGWCGRSAPCALCSCCSPSVHNMHCALYRLGFSQCTVHGVVVIVDFKCTLSLLVCTGDGGSSGRGELVAGDRVVLFDVFFTVLCTVMFNCVQLCAAVCSWLCKLGQDHWRR